MSRGTGRDGSTGKGDGRAVVVGGNTPLQQVTPMAADQGSKSKDVPSQNPKQVGLTGISESENVQTRRKDDRLTT